MKKVLFILLFTPFTLYAQYNDGMLLSRENDCYKHVAILLTQKKVWCLIHANLCSIRNQKTYI